MLESRQALSDYTKRHSRSMTEKERKDFEKQYVATFPGAEQTEPKILEFKTLEEAQEFKKLTDDMQEKQQAFFIAYLDYSNQKKNEQK